MKEITVIIPTTAELSRRHSLTRAIGSVTSQHEVSSKLIIVVNGNRFDQNVLLDLKSNPLVSLYYLDKGCLPSAIIYGRSLVETEYFSFLDDDDIYLEGSMSRLIMQMRNDLTIDVCVGNGVRAKGDAIIPMFKNLSIEEKSPLEYLCSKSGNWLASCAAVYRASSIGLEYFSDYVKYSEWTYLAFRLAVAKKIHFSNYYCYKIFDSEESLSKEGQYIFGQYDALLKIYSLPLPAFAKKHVRNKILEQRHSISEHYLNRGDNLYALKYHILSLSGFYGWRYMLYVRKIFYRIFSG